MKKSHLVRELEDWRGTNGIFQAEKKIKNLNKALMKLSAKYPEYQVLRLHTLKPDERYGEYDVERNAFHCWLDRSNGFQ